MKKYNSSPRLVLSDSRCILVGSFWEILISFTEPVIRTMIELTEAWCAGSNLHLTYWSSKRFSGMAGNTSGPVKQTTPLWQKLTMFSVRRNGSYHINTVTCRLCPHRHLIIALCYSLATHFTGTSLDSILNPTGYIYQVLLRQWSIPGQNLFPQLIRSECFMSNSLD